MSVVQRCFPSLICEQSVAISSWHTIRDGHKFRTCKKQFSDNRRRRSWRTMPVLFAPQIRPQKNQLSATATSRRSHHRWPDRPFEPTPPLAPRRSRDRRAPGKALRAFPKCNWDGVHNARNRDDPIFHRPNGHDVPDVRSSTFCLRSQSLSPFGVCTNSHHTGFVHGDAAIACEYGRIGCTQINTDVGR